MQSCRWTHVEGRPQVPCEYLECDRASVQSALMRPTTRPQMMASFGTGRWCHGHIGVVQSVDKLTRRVWGARRLRRAKHS